MEQRELDILTKYSAMDPELKNLWDDHKLYENQLEKLESKPYRTPGDEQQIRQIKKQKLDGKTRMIEIVQRYLKAEA